MQRLNVGVLATGRPGWVWLVLFAVWSLLLVCRPAQALSEEDFLPPEQAFVFSAAMAAPDTVALTYRIAPGYYMYRERFEIAADPPQAVTLGDPVYPPGKVKYDPTFEKDMETYTREVTVSVPLSGTQAVALEITSQGCADAGLCYPPQTHRVSLEPVPDGYVVKDGASQTRSPGWLTASTDQAGRTAGQSDSQSGALQQRIQTIPGAERPESSNGLGALLSAGDTGLADAISGLGWLKTAGVFFLLGLLLALTPCVLPMIPILSSIVVGGSREARPTRARGLGLAAAYVLGMSVVYTALGVAAGLSGAGLAAWLQTPWLLALFAALLVVLAVATFGAFDLQMPGGIQSWLSARSSRIPGGRITGALAMGAISALIVGPCVAAPLAGALLYISQTGDVWLGAAALFALAWGMGVPLLLVGASSGALLPKAGPWMDGVRRLFGMLLLATAWWMLIPITPTWLQMVGWALLAMVAAVMLRAFDALPAGAGAPRMFAKGIGILLALAAAAWLAGAVSGGRDVLQPLSHLPARTSAPQSIAAAHPIAFTRVRNSAELDAVLAQSTRPVMLDFYADWCVSCKEMERFTFSNPEVASKLAQMTLLQADVTQNNADDRELLKRFRLFGPPGIVFFEPGGTIVADARVVGFQDAARFSSVLDKVLQDR
ncbi:protein-disulfide reductase DsbD [Bordetella sp. 15P40C-2]|uniref:protein-disulfide reductase DsbD n=1 Tax=Bordetella sp. 15P40C-2 TaxID=2572246 RepID=UPI001322E2B9|nr:protein-disulfide reductase DsbD [Bordetella sp. 15P40C-2]MVW71291.1 protein-disulfide reductase DsbD [Bordetella sp. 15P40C-2]